MTLLATTAVPTESGLSFGGLLGVLRPVLDGLDALPARQAAALRSAFALGPATDPDRFAVATATLGLLAVAAQRGPLIVFVDDWHWLDPGSAQALAFAARRLGDDAVAFVATVRRGEAAAVPLDGLTVLDLSGLDLAGAAEMAAGYRRRDRACRPGRARGAHVRQPAGACKSRSPSSARWCDEACTRCQSTSPSARAWPPHCCNACGPFPNRSRSP